MPLPSLMYESACGCFILPFLCVWTSDLVYNTSFPPEHSPSLTQSKLNYSPLAASDSDWTCMYLRVHFELKQLKVRVKVLNVPICAIPPLAKPSMQVLYERVLRRPYPRGQSHVYIGMSLQNRPSKSLHIPLAFHSCLFLALFLSSVPLNVCQWQVSFSEGAFRST